MTDPAHDPTQDPVHSRRLDDDEPQFHVVDDGEDVHYDGPDEPPVGREFYEEKTKEH
jgi:hypothetical protein